jgi:hypothetical protein
VPARRIGLRIPHADGIAEFLIEGGPGGTRISKGETSGIATIEASFDVFLSAGADKTAVGRRRCRKGDRKNRWERAYVPQIAKPVRAGNREALTSWTPPNAFGDGDIVVERLNSKVLLNGAIGPYEAR